MRREYLRNIGIAAHIDAGKTTLTERILYFTGKSHKIGETHTGDSQMDTSKQEIEKGITISSAATHTSWMYRDHEHLFNIIDTPGHVDFIIEVERSLMVLDGLVTLFDAVAGVESQTETVWRQASKFDIPIVGFVNKMDRAGADFYKVVDQMKTRLGVEAVAIQIPIFTNDVFEGLIDLIRMEAYFWDKDGTMMIQEIPENYLREAELKRLELLEAIVIFDDQVFSKYLEDMDSLSIEEIDASLRKAVLKGQVIPVLLGAAYKNKGVQLLLDAVSAYLPSPLDRKKVRAIHKTTEESVALIPKSNEPLTALVFKVILDDRNRKLSFLRIFSGTLKLGDTVYNPIEDKTEVISSLYLMHANKRTKIQSAQVGDIVATMGLKHFNSGATMTTKGQELVLEKLHVPEAVISMAIEVKRSADVDKLGLALSKLKVEDPSLRTKYDDETGEVILLGMGELHLEIVIDKLKEKFNLEVNTGAPKVAYLEALSTTLQHTERLRRQTGGPGLFALIDVEIGPADEAYLQSDAFLKEEKRLQFVNQVVGGAIPRELIPSVADGFRAMMNMGPLAGFPMESLKVVLLDGQTHTNDSRPIAFELCAKEAFKKVAIKCEPVILEPIMQVEVNTPQEYVGNILSGLNRRRATIKSQENQFPYIQLMAEVPLSTMFGYVSHLREVSAGRANFTMKFDKYEPVTTKIAQEVILKEQR